MANLTDLACPFSFSVVSVTQSLGHVDGILRPRSDNGFAKCELYTIAVLKREWRDCHVSADGSFVKYYKSNGVYMRAWKYTGIDQQMKDIYFTIANSIVSKEERRNGFPSRVEFPTTLSSIRLVAVWRQR